jgi:hypothetical protein
MAFQISPGVNVSEVDLTTVVPSVLTTAGAIAGTFLWGPAFKIMQIDSEITLAQTFGTPNGNTYPTFMTCASFLAYGNNLNSDSNTSTTNVQVANEDIFEASYLNSNNGNIYGPFMGRYPGNLGNSLTVSVVDANTYSATWNVNSIGLASYVNGAPGTSAQASLAGASNDEIHIVVIDTGGRFTGTRNTVLEVFPYLSKSVDGIDDLGNSNYYKNYVFNNSKYVYAVDPVSYSTTNATWGNSLANTQFATLATVQNISLTGGADSPTQDSDRINGYSYFTNKEAVDISLVFTSDHSITVQQYVIDNIVNSRKDCIAFISPPSANVINQNGNETTNIVNWATSLNRSSSYVVADSGYKYMFDKYNNTYRWIPLNGDIAGLCVNTDNVRDPWFSPAGLNRGQIKNAVKLAWNPNKTQRDTLYSSGINPVVSFPGQGIVLYGDKTLQVKPSAFDRINVRRLFIVLEKTIAQAAQYSLFEFNDEFTRAQFVALVTPFLRDVQGRRGIYDFRVVCDTTNNTPQVIDSNQFVGDIYIKPARSINFIQLNFVAVRTGVDFTTIVGTA